MNLYSMHTKQVVKILFISCWLYNNFPILFLIYLYFISVDL